MSSAPPTSGEDALRILLVDDEPTNLDLLRHVLDGQGYRLFVAKNGEDALKVARKMRPRLVLLDVMMPGIDGFETCRRLRADPETSDAAVIFLSALDNEKDKLRGLEAGAIDFITKPFQGAQVITLVAKHLAVHRPPPGP